MIWMSPALSIAPCTRDSNAAKSALSATMLRSGVAVQPHSSPLGWLAVGLIFAAFAQLIARGVAMRAELDTVI